MGKSESEIPAEKLALYEKLVATRPDIERKGASMPYTSLNGNMFSFMMPGGTMPCASPRTAAKSSSISTNPSWPNSMGA